MTRFMFWRNLLPAYDTEYGEGRGRFDVFLLVIAVYAVAPQILNWPTKEDGTVCFKLDRLTPAKICLIAMRTMQARMPLPPCSLPN